MSRVELNHHLDFETVPTPGTLSHLQWLANLELPPVTNAVELNGFFEYTKATRSLANLIRNHRTHRPIISPTVDLDTRLLGLSDPNVPNFRGSVYRHPSFSDRAYLAFRGGVPNGQEIPPGEHSYQFFIPLHHDFSYDAFRPSEASFVYTDEQENQYRSAYVSAAYPEYEQSDPQVMVEIVRQASADMLRLMSHLYDWQGVTQSEYKTIAYPFNPKGLVDDPFEFVPPSGRSEFEPQDGLGELAA